MGIALEEAEIYLLNLYSIPTNVHNKRVNKTSEKANVLEGNVFRN